MKKETGLKTEQLQIGSWVQKDDKYLQVISVHIDGARCFNGNTSEYYTKETLQGIEINRGMLESFKFQIDDDSNCMYRIIDEAITIFIYFDKQDKLESVTLQVDDVNFGECTATEINIKYIHQLQNLCIALGGEELSIN